MYHSLFLEGTFGRFFNKFGFFTEGGGNLEGSELSGTFKINGQENIFSSSRCSPWTNNEGREGEWLNGVQGTA